MGFKRVINCVETHDGEPMRVVTGGIGPIRGNSVYEMEEYLRQYGDGLRKFLLREPRGYPPMCCNVIVPPKDPSAAAGFIIMEQTEYPMMSGGNVISVATVLLETGMIPAKEGLNEFILECPAGLIGIKAMYENDKVTAVTFKNVPAFAVYVNKEIEVPHIGHGVEKVTVDVAWGSMFYVMADVRQFPWVALEPDQGREITRISSLILKAAQDQLAQMSHGGHTAKDFQRPGDFHFPALRTEPEPGKIGCQECRNRSLRCRRFRQPVYVDRRFGPLPLRYRYLRKNGSHVCQRRTEAERSLPS